MSELRIESRQLARNPVAFTTDFCAAASELRHPDYREGMMGASAEELLLNFPGIKSKELFLAKDGGKIVGRALGRLANGHDGLGYVGFFEVDTSHPRHSVIAQHLLGEVCAYLRAKGAREVTGPIDINTWFSYRFRTDQSDALHFAWEPCNPPIYSEYFLANGFEQSEGYHSELMVGMADFVQRNRKGYDRSLLKGISYREINRANPRTDLDPIYEVSMGSFADAYLFEPIPRSVFEMVYVPSVAKRQAEGCFLAFDANTAVGLVFSFVDNSGYVIKTLAVKPSHRGIGISNGLLYLTGQRAQQLGYDSAVSAMVKTGNLSEHGARKTRVGWQHHYALYRKTL